MLKVLCFRTGEAIRGHASALISSHHLLYSWRQSQFYGRDWFIFHCGGLMMLEVHCIKRSGRESHYGLEPLPFRL
jgi:hypothetical protein